MLNQNLFVIFGQTIKVLPMKLKDDLRLCMKLNTAKCERCALSIFRVLLAHVKITIFG